MLELCDKDFKSVPHKNALTSNYERALKQMKKIESPSKRIESLSKEIDYIKKEPNENFRT